MKPIFPALAAVTLAVFAVCTQASTTYDLRQQWSNKVNPNGPWTLEEGNDALPRDRDWTPLSESDAAYNPPEGHIRQPAFAPGSKPGNFLPAWFKAVVTPATPGNGWRKHDVIVHTTDPANGSKSGPASVVFTATSAGLAQVSGYLYNARNLRRPQHWLLTLNGSELGSGLLPGDGSIKRANPTRFSIPDVALQAGDEIVLKIERDGGSGDYVGLDLQVTQE
jgi:hypothetical protein